MNFMGHAVTFNYAIKENNFTPKAISINGKPVRFTYEDNKYRQGGAVIPVNQFTAMLDKQENIIEIQM